MQPGLKNIITKIVLNNYLFVIYVISTTVIANTVLAKNINQDSLVLKPDQLNTKDSSKVSEVKTKSPRIAMICSLAFPGLGQLYNEKKLKALVFCGAEFSLLANSIYWNQMYKKSIDPFYKNLYIENRNVSTWWLVGVLLFSILDAYVDAHLYNFDESPDLSIDLQQSPEKQRIMLSLSVSF